MQGSPVCAPLKIERVDIVVGGLLAADVSVLKQRIPSCGGVYIIELSPPGSPFNWTPVYCGQVGRGALRLHTSA